MGYDVSVMIEDVVIPGPLVKGALQALGELMDCTWEQGGGGSWTDGKKTSACYSWVNTDVVLAALEKDDLCAVLGEWRYSAEEYDPPTPIEQLATGSRSCSVRICYFEGSKLGDDDMLWQSLAPFIQTGAVVTFIGEDDSRWRYVFEDGDMVEQWGTIVWE